MPPYNIVRSYDEILCPVCGKKYILAGALKNHLERKHQDKSHHVCSDCGTVFDDEKTFGQHFQKHPPAVLSRMKCPSCGKGYKRESSFKRHLYEKHQSDHD